ncbi:MaoC family dehydratase N-terminal domain-containing protein [Bradyrhizobium sp. UNPF46]|uniref:MaoC family dehydratase n=1 Tax=Bradyrhizobium sp. UNPF46 TaxID=1141168 RepID=UPI001154C09C|nr:MaoC family dehydratase N-terminal domain-containing protein [Bradyrhizobium sp. UNPF46]
MNKYKSVVWEDVQEGEKLPSYEYELSLLRLVAFVRASGLYDYVHFDGDYARAVGVRDAFIATPHVAGLFGRLLSDWSGPDASLRKLTFSLNKPSCVNDVLTVSGSITRKYRGEDGETLVDIDDLRISYPDADGAATGQATLSLPSRDGRPMQNRRATATKPATRIDPEMPEVAKAKIGVVSECSQGRSIPISEDELLLWCEAIEDWNPLYWDKEYASTTPHGRLIAPPFGMLLGPGSSVQLGLGYKRPGAATPLGIEKGLRGLPLLQSMRKGWADSSRPLSIPGYPELAVVKAETEFYTPLGVGDTIRVTEELLECSGRKKTRLGEGYFGVYVKLFFNQADDLAKCYTSTIFHYRV